MATVVNKRNSDIVVFPTPAEKTPLKPAIEPAESCSLTQCIEPLNQGNRKYKDCSLFACRFAIMLRGLRSKKHGPLPSLSQEMYGKRRFLSAPALNQNGLTAIKNKKKTRRNIYYWKKTDFFALMVRVCRTRSLLISGCDVGVEECVFISKMD